MPEFPRTEVGGVSMPRMIIGSNWFCGYSHQTAAKDGFIRAHQDATRVAEIFAVYLEHGIDAVIGCVVNHPMLHEAARRAEDQAGRRVILIDTPGFPMTPEGVDFDGAARVMDASASLGATFCMPHQCTTDALMDRTTRSIRQMDRLSAMIRERGMIPGLSTHMPEAPVYADESGADVATYVQIYNAVGFLMQVEVEWAHHIIMNAQRPVLTIKPMAAGRLTPFVGLAFAWSTLRNCDMVAVGALTPDEAREDIELSFAMLEHRYPQVALQRTRSKKLIDGK